MEASADQPAETTAEQDNIIEIVADEHTVQFVAEMIAAIKWPTQSWQGLPEATQGLMLLNAQIILTGLSTLRRNEKDF